MLSPLDMFLSSFMTHGTTPKVVSKADFLRLIEILPVVEPGGPITGPKWGWTSTLVIYGYDWVDRSTRDLYQKP
jgi:hypothetical protein